MNLTVKLLKQLGACQNGIEFCEHHKLIGFPLDRLPEIKGYHRFAEWLYAFEDIQLDGNGDVAYYKKATENLDGSPGVYFEKWMQYDDHGNVIWSRDSDGSECSYTFIYDDRGNLVYFRDQPGFEEWTIYDFAANRMVYRETAYDNDVCTQLWDYDDHGNMVHYKHSDGYEYWKQYDECGRVVHYRNEGGLIETWEYDERGNVLHHKYASGREYWNTFDEANNLIHTQESGGYEMWRDYDDKGRLIHYRHSSDVEYWYEYDDRNNQTRRRCSSGSDRYFVFEYYDDGQLKKIDDCDIPFFVKDV
jgi:YD repeat-containing protein